ncbi:hypothetical protein AB6806_23915 [Bosea sp. RCC_152_1]|uniref:hypothetical protein n=1 Tax=Bosea sp. RCC_152_1 TaxID=3239228 RepID=UPI003523E37A
MAAKKAYARERYLSKRESMIQASLASYYRNQEARKAYQRVRNAAAHADTQEIAAGIELSFAMTLPEHRQSLALALLDSPEQRVQAALRVPRVDYGLIARYSGV